ncbi:MAG: inositol monophosphatase, partial [Actinobacteria bacterium]|nr:inositol monophosphatase [Actinomycetota bacterium]
MTPTSANEALAVAKQLARSAGDMALAGRKAGLHNVQTKSTGTDMVTEFDRASEAKIFDGLRTLRPLDSVVGEEGAAHSGESDITWFI